MADEEPMRDNRNKTKWKRKRKEEEEEREKEREEEEEEREEEEEGEEEEEEEERFHFFHAGPFSQWHKSSFRDKEGNLYNTAEQYMMYHKAILFHDEKVAKQILRTKNPKEQKQLGREVKGFTEKVWKKNRIQIVREASLFKFRQNEQLRLKLFQTFPKTLVEASPNDYIWGIGLHAEDPRAKYRSEWRGENLLGQTLTEVRQQLMDEFPEEKEK